MATKSGKSGRLSVPCSRSSSAEFGLTLHWNDCSALWHTCAFSKKARFLLPWHRILLYRIVTMAAAIHWSFPKLIHSRTSSIRVYLSGALGCIRFALRIEMAKTWTDLHVFLLTGRSWVYSQATLGNTVIPNAAQRFVCMHARRDTSCMLMCLTAKPKHLFTCQTNFSLLQGFEPRVIFTHWLHRPPAHKNFIARYNGAFPLKTGN